MSELSEIQIIDELYSLSWSKYWPFQGHLGESEYNELREALLEQKEKTNSCNYCKLLIDVIIHLIDIFYDEAEKEKKEKNNE